MALKPNAGVCSIREQTIEDPVSGLTLQFSAWVAFKKLGQEMTTNEEAAKLKRPAHDIRAVTIRCPAIKHALAPACLHWGGKQHSIWLFRDICESPFYNRPKPHPELHFRSGLPTLDL